VWNALHNFTAKILYGSAFRPPSFAELYNENNPFTLGNENLKPEQNKTVEFNLNYQPVHQLKINVNTYVYRLSNLIQFVSDEGQLTSTAQNVGSQTGYGIETELRWSLIDDLKMNAHVSKIFIEDNVNDQSLGYGFSPGLEVFIEGEYRMTSDLKLSMNVNWVTDRVRSVSDTRPKIDDYMIVNSNIRWNIKKYWELALLGKNISDSDVREPSQSPSVINDIPTIGRSYHLTMRFAY